LRAAMASVLAAGDDARLRLAAHALLDFLDEHLAHEDELLAPVLRTIDAWGAERERRLRQEHAEQRTEIARLRAALAPTSPEPMTLASELRHFVDLLRGDMAAEERDTLTASVLRDDCICIEIGG